MRLLITAPYNEKGRNKLEEAFGEVIYKSWKTQNRAYTAKELIELLKESQADALITEHDEVNEEVISAFPNLKFIGVCRGTPSNVAVNLAKEKGIAIFHTPARNAQAVAEMFVANVITFMRKTISAIDWLEEGKWDEGAHTSYLEFKGNELAGKKIGMIGFGAVGQTIARLVENFPCEILYYDPFYTSENTNFKKVDIETAFADADIVSINLPVTDETKGMINKDLISLMKPESIFVNTSRAVVVKREDLLDALESKKIKGAIIDVFDHEPPDELDYKIIRLPQVLATPHIAGATHEVEDHHVEILNKKLIQWLKEVDNVPVNIK